METGIAGSIKKRMKGEYVHEIYEGYFLSFAGGSRHLAAYVCSASVEIYLIVGYNNHGING